MIYKTLSIFTNHNDVDCDEILIFSLDIYFNLIKAIVLSIYEARIVEILLVLIFPSHWFLFRYQQEGINWLAFLKRFKLHGILCDDMGLGKTLQASAIVACDIVERLTLNNREVVPPSLIICPSTLVGHWAFEIEKYVDVSILSTLQYVGSVQDRISLRECFKKYSVIITSYDVVRKDIEYLSQIHWNYCILDEGHIIRNAKSKITLAVKQLRSQNRLVLSGTPIQVSLSYQNNLR